MGRWVETLDSIPSSGNGCFMEYQVRISTSKGIASTRQPLAETMLWARFSNLFPRDEAFRLKRTRNSEGTGGDGPIMAHSKPINPTAPTSASTGRSMNVEDSSSQRGEAEAEESELELDEDSPSDLSASYIPPSLSRKRKRYLIPISNTTLSEFEAYYNKKLFLKGLERIPPPRQNAPPLLNRRPCLLVFPLFETKPNANTLFMPNRIHGLHANCVFEFKFSKEWKGEGERDDEGDAGHGNANANGKGNMQWLYDATGDRFVLVEMKER
ncbi:hypothetical protein BJ165DRAFT_1591547 [Panaeolus papilionaceus]|nr:hypothetical protein BJ165DRAFT_1591547 [Panaeolus papilionaceus]